MAVLRVVFIFGRGLDRSQAAPKADPIKLSHRIISCHQKPQKQWMKAKERKRELELVVLKHPLTGPDQVHYGS